MKEHSIFEKLLYPFDLIRSFAIDWMHCVCLGVVKYIMRLQMSDGNRDKPFYLGAKKASISRQLLSIKPPDIVGRLPRSVEDMKLWKATELKNWLLHYSVAVLRNIKCTACFSLVFACRCNRNFVFRLNIPRRSETC